MVKATKGHKKCFLEADWLKTTGVISGVPVLPCHSSPRPPLPGNQIIHANPLDRPKWLVNPIGTAAYN